MPDPSPALAAAASAGLSGADEASRSGLSLGAPPGFALPHATDGWTGTRCTATLTQAAGGSRVIRSSEYGAVSQFPYVQHCAQGQVGGVRS